ncbi:zinc-binding alcohol dehydrogenase family protein [Acidothermaceae bacterium B102]|nr:zinc-binding alcohol dehydrogenase family protein [Acidothermaceae bacterium B102]
MKAAVVSSFDTPPQYDDLPAPTAARDHELVVDVIAAGLHPRVRSQADGSHYTSTERLPLVPGIDGVGRGADGLLRYFILPDATLGSMAEQTVIDTRRSVVLPDGTDPLAVAAGMNPAMSSWVALRCRVAFEAGQNVLVLGATGNAGRMAIQVARLFGAQQVIAVGRGGARLADLAALGASTTVAIDADEMGQSGAEVDVVLDYLWGEPASTAMAALVTARADRSRPLTWIQIGSVAGATAAIPSAALRAAQLQIVGSGQGSVGTAEIIAELPGLAQALSHGTFAVDALATPLAHVERVWSEPSTRRVVLTP